MKNSTLIKGTAAIAVGAALLLGGGGTLAAWNDSVTANPGTIIAGNLDLQAGSGTWTDANGTAITNIGSYRVVPGDVLTFTQVLDVTLEGNKMAAKVTPTVPPATSGFGNNVDVSPLSLQIRDASGNLSSIPNELKTSSTVVATIKFTFKAGTAGQDATKATYNFNEVGFTLSQDVPTAPAQQ